MSEEWPPTGYSDPKLYETNNSVIIGIAMMLILPVVYLTRPSLRQGAAKMVKWSVELGESFGLIHYLILYLILVALATLIWILGSGALIIAFHEAVHYVTAKLQGFDPQFEWRQHLWLKNPSIVIYAEGISRKENVLILASPFVLLSILCGVFIWFTTGLVAATAAAMFCFNAVPSCADLYNTGRIAQMPKGTLFANFDADGDLRSEFVTPNVTGSESL